MPPIFGNRRATPFGDGKVVVGKWAEFQKRLSLAEPQIPPQFGPFLQSEVKAGSSLVLALTSTHLELSISPHGVSRDFISPHEEIAIRPQSGFQAAARNRGTPFGQSLVRRVPGEKSLNL